MFKYKVRYFGYDDVLEFKSRYHIAMLKAKSIGKLSLVNFKDANVTINLPYIEELRINNKTYKLKEYEV